MRRLDILSTTFVALMTGAAGARAQEPSAADLAKQLSNPVASLVSIPLQYNWDQGVGIDDDTRTTMNFQPVIPLGLSDDWNLIIRWIMPYVSQPRLADGVGPTSGLSDIVASTFFSPAEPGAFHLGRRTRVPAADDERSATRNGQMGGRSDIRHPEAAR